MGKQNTSKVDDWLFDDKLELLKCWARDFTLTEIAEKMGITSKTFIEWRREYPEIEEAIKEGKEVVDYKVENALLKVALGYTTTEVKTITGYPDKNGNRKTRTETLIKEVPPNPTAIMCWLNNRKPENWKRNRDLFQTNDKNANITVNIIKHDNEENDDEWIVDSQIDDKPIKKRKSKKNNKQTD